MERQFAIFDLDGTLIDSMGYWQRTERAYLNARGVTEDIEETLAELRPLTIVEAGAVFIRRFGLPGTPESIGGALQAEMERRYREEIPLKDGAAAYLAALARRGVRMCVASATRHDLMEECLNRLGVLDRFAFTISCLDVGAGKGRPDVYLQAAARLGASPAETAVYEDAPYALRTAGAAGFHPVAVYDESAAGQWAEAQAAAEEAIRDWHSAAAALEAGF